MLNFGGVYWKWIVASVFFLAPKKEQKHTKTLVIQNPPVIPGEDQCLEALKSFARSLDTNPHKVWLDVYGKKHNLTTVSGVMKFHQPKKQCTAFEALPQIHHTFWREVWFPPKWVAFLRDSLGVGCNPQARVDPPKTSTHSWNYCKVKNAKQMVI